jgi:hypothetical protein
MFGVWGSRTATGNIMSGRNLDWQSQTGVSKHKVTWRARRRRRAGGGGMRWASRAPMYGTNPVPAVVVLSSSSRPPLAVGCGLLAVGVRQLCTTLRCAPQRVTLHKTAVLSPAPIPPPPPPPVMPAGDHRAQDYGCDELVRQPGLCRGPRCHRRHVLRWHHRARGCVSMCCVVGWGVGGGAVVCVSFLLFVCVCVGGVCP